METLSDSERQFIREAAAYLESPNSFIQAMNLIGRPLESVEHRLPAPASQWLQRATRKALEGALRLALKTLPSNMTALNFATADRMATRTGRQHLVTVSVTGGLAGAFGWAALPIELPVTTTLMLRSIAGIAAGYGVDLSLPESRLECLYVFTLGKPSPADDSTDTSYYASRMAFGRLISDAVRGLEHGTAPALTRLITAIASRFNASVTEKALAEAIPVIGALGGAAINAAFSDYFNSAARFHFGLKCLEKSRGAEAVRGAYAEAARSLKKS